MTRYNMNHKNYFFLSGLLFSFLNSMTDVQQKALNLLKQYTIFTHNPSPGKDDIRSQDLLKAINAKNKEIKKEKEAFLVTINNQSTLFKYLPSELKGELTNFAVCPLCVEWPHKKNPNKKIYKYEGPLQLLKHPSFCPTKGLDLIPQLTKLELLLISDKNHTDLYTAIAYIIFKDLQNPPFKIPKNPLRYACVISKFTKKQENEDEVQLLEILFSKIATDFVRPNLFVVDPPQDPRFQIIREV